MSDGVLGRSIAAARRWLPVGNRLPLDVWASRHRVIVGLAWAHAVGIPIYALIQGFGPSHAAVEGSGVALAAALASWPALSRRTRTVAASLGLLTSSAVIVHLSGGVIEAHFHFFVMVAVASLYQDWLPFLAAIAFVLLHHGIVGTLDPHSVYDHPAAWRRPWTWAAVHSGFIAALSAVCVGTWRLNEMALSDRVDAEDRLREETRIAETLRAVGDALSSDLDTQRVVQAVTDAATQRTNASFGAFFYNHVDEHGESYLLYTLSGAPVSAFESFGLPRNTPIFAPTFAGDGVVRLEDVLADPRYGHMEPHRGMPKGHLPVRSYLAVPVRSRGGEVLGGLFFGHPEPGVFTRADERIVVGIAAEAAMALDNARLYESEREARVVVEEAHESLALLADASRILTSSLECDDLLRGLGDLVVPGLAEAYAVTVVEPDGSLRVVRGGPASASPHPLLADQHLVERVVASGVAIVPGPAQAVVPLVVRERVLGAMNLARAGGFSEPQRLLIDELARRAAVAVENAGLFARQRDLAETLQHSLLPDRLPEIPGLSTAARYLAGGPGVEVGGDWYDIFALPGNLVGLAIGDVVGRGERAAALMGQLRNALRAYGLDGKTPVEVIDALNGLVASVSGEHMATILFASLNLETGEFRYANAGHMPPLVLSADGTARFLDAGGGPPVGAVASARYRDASTVLPPGACVLLYTDGLVEERGVPLDRSLDDIRLAALTGPADPGELCDALVAGRQAAGRPQDDVAVMAVRFEALGDHLSLRLPLTPLVLAPLRATMRRWLSRAGASEHESYELLLALGEASTNAIRHGGTVMPAFFEVEAIRDADVTIRVWDPGRWRESRRTIGGRGLAIIENVADDVHIDAGVDGTTVTIRRRLGVIGPEVATT